MNLTSHPLARPFRDTWTLEDNIFTLETERPANQTTHPGLKKFKAAAGGHLLHLVEQGKVNLVPHSENRQIRWADLLNTVISGGDLPEYFQHPDRLVDALGEPFYKVIFEAAYAPKDKPISQQEQFERVVNAIEAGNFRPFLCGECYSFESGERFNLQVSNWNATLMTWDDTGKYQPLTAAAKPETIEHAVLECPSGEIWVADWIRIPEFTQLTETWENPEDDINSSGGRIATTHAYAAHGLISVFAGGGNLSIVRQGDRLMIGELMGEDDPKAVAPQGVELERKISIQLNWATLIDKQVLIERLSEALGEEEAKAKVDGYVDDDLIKIHVIPGTYHLYFTGRPQSFGEYFKSSEVSTQGFECPILVMSPTALALGASPAVPPPRRRNSTR